MTYLLSLSSVNTPCYYLILEFIFPRQLSQMCTHEMACQQPHALPLKNLQRKRLFMACGRAFVFHNSELFSSRHTVLPTQALISVWDGNRIELAGSVYTWIYYLFVQLLFMAVFISRQIPPTFSPSRTNQSFKTSNSTQRPSNFNCAEKQLHQLKEKDSFLYAIAVILVVSSRCICWAVSAE